MSQLFLGVNIFVGSKLLGSPNFDPLKKIEPQKNLVGFQVFWGGQNVLGGQKFWSGNNFEGIRIFGLFKFLAGPNLGEVNIFGVSKFQEAKILTHSKKFTPQKC